MFHRFKKYFAQHCKNLPSLNALFAQDPQRTTRYQVQAAGLNLDFSRQRLNDESLQRLDQYCEETELKTKIQAMFLGKKINVSEQRPVLHVALRGSVDPELRVDRINLPHHIQEQLDKMKSCVTRLHQGQWQGATQKAITDVVNIGIGGSDLGPRMVTRALRPYHQRGIKVHFVANADPADMEETLQKLSPETTLFILASKSFTTQETFLNAQRAKDWLTQHLGHVNLESHFIAATAKPEKAKEWGIAPQHLFEIWDCIGGRFSLWSSMGLAIAIQIGMDHFKALLQGAHELDQHFLSAPASQNLPILLAFLSCLNQNMLGAQSHAVVPYLQALELFPAYLQQADMESNGKGVNLKGKSIKYHTGVPLWGGVGTNGQHAFHELLHQGTLPIPVDFILVLQASDPQTQKQHNTLLANALAQAEALRRGKDVTTAEAEFKAAGFNDKKAKQLAPHKVLPGNRPSNLILIDQLSPKHLGALIALYEHKIFVQSLIWEIDAFDQWGVELGKQLASPLLDQINALPELSLSTLHKLSS